MSIHGYNNCYKRFLNEKVKKFVRDKYQGKGFIECAFNVFYVDIERGIAHSYEPEVVSLKRKDYTSLLTLLIEHPNLSFQELPLHISSDLYRQLLVSLRFHIMGESAHPMLPETYSKPAGIEMSTLHRDAEELIGDRDDSCSLLLQSYTYHTQFQEVYVSVWMGLMEVSINFVKEGRYFYSKYGLIDLGAIKRALGIEPCSQLYESFERLKVSDRKEESDIHWLIRWLDRNKIKYVFAEDVC